MLTSEKVIPVEADDRMLRLVVKQGKLCSYKEIEKYRLYLVSLQ